jgi:MFS family permease
MTVSNAIEWFQVVAVLPFSLTVRFGVPEADVPFWTSTSLIVFGVAMVFGSPIAGWIVGKCERSQIPFLAGLSCAFGSTVLFMIGSAPWVIIVARIFQGLSAGVVYTAGLTLLVNTIESHELGPWIGFGLSGMNLGVLVSPTLGGVVYEKAGFYPVFVMSLGVVAVNLALILLIIDRKAAVKHQPHDSQTRPSSSNGSSPRSAVANGKRRLSRVEDGEAIETSPLITYCGELADTFPTEPTWWTVVGGFLSSPRILAALYGSLINIILVSSMDAVLPVFVKHTFHWLSGATGAIFLNLTIPSLTGPLVGMISDRYGVRPVAIIGFVFAGIGVVLLALIQHNTVTDHVMACILLFLVGML